MWCSAVKDYQTSRPVESTSARVSPPRRWRVAATLSQICHQVTKLSGTNKIVSCRSPPVPFTSLYRMPTAKSRRRSCKQAHCELFDNGATSIRRRYLNPPALVRRRVHPPMGQWRRANSASRKRRGVALPDGRPRSGPSLPAHGRSVSGWRRCRKPGLTLCQLRKLEAAGRHDRLVAKVRQGSPEHAIDAACEEQIGDGHKCHGCVSRPRDLPGKSLEKVGGCLVRALELAANHERGPRAHGRVTCRRRRTYEYFRSGQRRDASFVELIVNRNRNTGESVRLGAIAPLRIHLVGGSERLALVYTEEGARTLSPRIFDCRERLFDELAACDFSVGEELRKLGDGQCGEPMS
jgi:hypothetical protein